MADDVKATPVKFEVTEITPEDTGESLEEALGKMILKEWVDGDKPVLAPATLYTTAPYAPYVEFGTGPAKPGNKSADGPLDQKLIDWVQVKLKVDEKKAPEVAKKIAKKIWREGIAPQPYFRSAVYGVLDEFCTEDSKYLDEEKGSIVKLCEEMQRRIKEDDMGIRYSGGTSLVDSFEIEAVETTAYDIVAKTGDDYVRVTIDDTETTPPDELWEDRNKGINNKRPAHYNKR